MYVEVHYRGFFSATKSGKNIEEFLGFFVEQLMAIIIGMIKI